MKKDNLDCPFYGIQAHLSRKETSERHDGQVTNPGTLPEYPPRAEKHRSKATQGQATSQNKFLGGKLQNHENRVYTNDGSLESTNAKISEVWYRGNRCKFMADLHKETEKKNENQSHPLGHPHSGTME